MEPLHIIFVMLLFAIGYPYVGYPVILAIINFIKPASQKSEITPTYPTVTLFVTAYNESAYVDEKVQNSLKLSYPPHKLKLVWVTDGSTDDTNQKLAQHPQITVYFEPQRLGKIAAMNRGMQFIDTDIVVFTDANTFLNPEAITEIVHCFNQPNVACVAGEKRILPHKAGNAAGLGEGLYWRYESAIKKLDARLGNAIGAPGELFAIRRTLFSPVEADTILDDFIISMRLALKGYKIDYTPTAYAMEKPSADIGEEMKRKIRIAAGSFQAFFRLKALWFPFKKPWLWFQYTSHKVFRWMVAPLALPLLFLVNLVICLFQPTPFFNLVLALQITFYTLTIMGHFLRNRPNITPTLFIPYYFTLANVAMWRGFIRYIRRAQPAAWDQAKRMA